MEVSQIDRTCHGPFRHARGSPLAGFTVPIVLLLLRDGRHHGYALRDEIEAEGLVDDVDFGNLYRALRRMEEVGLVISCWENSAEGPGRRVYTITPEGERYLAETAEGLRRHHAAVERFFRRYEQGRR